MSKQKFLITALFLAFFQVLSAAEAAAQTVNPRDYPERFAVQAVRSVLSAQMTYQATSGQGTFGTLAELRQANFIDDVLASGKKYGYAFTLTRTHATATLPPRFFLTATPQSYPKTGRRSFYIDETGEMRGADKGGASADSADPVIDDCASFGIFFNERCVINDLRSFWGAEMTYASAIGAGAYGTFPQLLAAGLIGSGRANANNHGYTFTVHLVNPSAGTPAFFSIKATPINYGISGTRSFYIDTDAIIRGGDRLGQPADRNDPPINE